MFKRRKAEDIKTTPAGQTTPSSGPSGAPASSGHGAIFPASTGGAAKAGAAASGAAPAPSSPSPSQPNKEIATMGRAPFPSAPGSFPATPGAGAPPAGMAAARTAQPAKQEDERRTLVVGRGISVQGTVQDAERLVVEGTVESSMIHAVELSVTQGGLFRGSVEVEDAEIAGTVDGTLVVRGSLTVSSTGRLLGKATCKRLRVEDGGQISGQLEMLTDKSAPSAPVSTPAPTPAPAPAAASED